MNQDELALLEKIAKEATPGPYKVEANIPFYCVVNKPASSMSKHDEERPTYWRYEDGVYHAAFTPEKVLQLMDLLNRATNALQTIANQDFRGNRPHECTIAYNALKSIRSE